MSLGTILLIILIIALLGGFHGLGAGYGYGYGHGGQIQRVMPVGTALDCGVSSVMVDPPVWNAP